MSKPADLPSKTSSSSFWHTEPKLLGYRTTESLPRKVDIVVIGSGISGASVVHHIFENSEDGEKEVEKPDVLVLEARDVCWGATGR
jgi:lysine/ornithine N-monooxygenase